MSTRDTYVRQISLLDSLSREIEGLQRKIDRDREYCRNQISVLHPKLSLAEEGCVAVGMPDEGAVVDGLLEICERFRLAVQHVAEESPRCR
jgi:hypothetical protein